jgi:O-antigen biosynthesis protein
MPRVSVFTPSHDGRYLDEAHDSLIGQSFSDFEWIVLRNKGNAWVPKTEDSRITLLDDRDSIGVGALKQVACRAASGEFLVELDHDDVLTPDALERVVLAFEEREDCGFVYSNAAQILSDGQRCDDMFNLAMGWSYRDVEVNGHSLLQLDSFLPFPSNVSYIWFAPNHLRAFRRSAYEAVGGYDPDMTVLDDQDLMCRLYEYADFHLIDECLYLQRVHADNTQAIPDVNEFIQRETVRLYDLYAERNALAFARRKGLFALDLGAAHNKPEGYLGVDRYPGESVDIVADVSKGIDLPDNSVGVIRAVDFLEHVEDKVALMNECYRLLAHGGMLLSLTPSTDGRGAFQDPTHVAYYNENSFWYFINADYARFVPEINCRFQLSRLVTYAPDEWHEHHNILYVNANLVAIKDGPRLGGELLI